MTELDVEGRLVALESFCAGVVARAEDPRVGVCELVNGLVYIGMVELYGWSR